MLPNIYDSQHCIDESNIRSLEPVGCGGAACASQSQSNAHLDALVT